MVRALVIIMVATLVLAVCSFAGMFAVGGREFARGEWNWPESLRKNGYDISIREAGDVGPDTTRTIPWTGSEALQIDLPADVVYTQGAETKVELSGPAELLDRVAFDGDRLQFIDDDRAGADGSLRVSITAPSVKRFIVNGSGALSIHDYDQDSLAVELNGSGNVEGAGRTASMAVVLAGSGDVDLGEVETRDASVDMAGSGGVRVNPTGAAKVRIAGSGDVHLLTQPARLENEVSGSGKVKIDE